MANIVACIAGGRGAPGFTGGGGTVLVATALTTVAFATVAAAGFAAAVFVAVIFAGAFLGAPDAGGFGGLGLIGISRFRSRVCALGCWPDARSWRYEDRGLIGAQNYTPIRGVFVNAFLHTEAGFDWFKGDHRPHRVSILHTAAVLQGLIGRRLAGDLRSKRPQKMRAIDGLAIRSSSD